MDVAELKAIRDGQRHMIQACKTDMADNGFYDRTEAQLTGQIAALQKHLDAMRDRRANGPALIEAGLARITEINTQIKLIENAKQIAELLALNEKLAK